MSLIVNALIGQSGSGKSYRAIMLAHQLEIDLIIDDGLLIHNNQIVAGYSAKQQPTRIGAIKTALFQDETHCQAARTWISAKQPNSVLILGTSGGMITKIANRLGLPLPTRKIMIEEIATAHEIKTALRQRNQFGNHIIPVPMAEVKQKVPTKLIRSLQVFFTTEPPVRNKAIWADQTIIRPNFTGYGNFYITENAFLKLIELFFEVEHPNFLLKQVYYNTKQTGSELSIKLAVPYGEPIHLALQEIHQELRQKLLDLTGVPVVKLVLEASELIFER